MRVFSNTAISLDGRIATTAFDHIRLGTDEDIRRMSLLRAQADAVLMGGRSFRNFPRPALENPRHVVRDQLRNRPMVTAVWTQAGVAQAVVPAQWGPEVSLVVYGPERLDVVAHEAVGAEVVGAQTIEQVLGDLEERGVENLLIEGGGDLIFKLLQANLLHEVNMTLCPTLIGGVGAPTLCDGAGFGPEALRHLHLQDLERVGDELYLRYAVQRPVA